MTRKLKIALTVLYVLTVGFGAFYGMGFLYYFRNAAFVVDHEAQCKSEDPFFMATVGAIAENHPHEVYAAKTPLFQETFENGGQKATFEIHHAVFFHGSSKENVVFFLLKNYTTNDLYHIESLNIQFEYYNVIKDGQTNIQRFEYTISYDYCYFTYLKENSFVDNEIKLKAITIQDEVQDTILLIKSEDNPSQAVDSSLNVLDKRFNIQKADYDLTEIDYQNDSRVAYYPNLINELNSYNYIIWLLVAAYVLVVAIITYFIYFHRLVLRRIRMKQQIKHEKAAHIYKEESKYPED
jgi:hypothetical protein